MTAQIPEPPAGTGVVAGQQLYQYPPMVPGIQTVNAPAVTTPAVPGSGSVTTNTTGVDVNVYISSTTSVTSVVLNGGTLPGGIPTANATGDYYLPAGQTIVANYSGTLSWKWLAV